MKIIKISILLILVILKTTFSQTLLKDNDHEVNKALNLLIEDEELIAAGFGFYAIDVNTGEVIAQHNENLVLKSASTLKIVSTAAALELLGSDYTFKTTIEYDGILDTNINYLDGNIYIRGGGDPTLGSKYFAKTKSKQFLTDWLNAIKKLGIDSISGAIIGDADLYSEQIVPTTWAWEDIGNYFGAGACGLSIYDNFYTIYLNTNSQLDGENQITKVEPEIPGLTFDNKTTATKTNDDDSFIFGQPYKYDRIITGELPMNEKDFKIKGSIPDPAWFAAYDFTNFLIANNIKIAKPATTTRLMRLNNTIILYNCTPIFVTESPKLSDIIYCTNQNSINLFAEHCLCHAGLTLVGDADTKIAADAVENYWNMKGMKRAGLSINDGSGLSHYNAISAKQLTFILKYMKTSSRYYDDFYKSLPISGKSGTLKNVCEGTIAEEKIHAKSGTIRNVKCYTGYTTSSSGREIAFAMMINNYSCTTSKVKEKLESLMIAMVELSL